MERSAFRNNAQTIPRINLKGKELEMYFFVVSFIEFRSPTVHFFCEVPGGWFLGRYPKTMRTRELFSKLIAFQNFEITCKGTCSSVAGKTVYRLIELGTTLKIKKICFSSKVSIQPCRPKSDSALPGAIWAQFRPKKLNQKAIPAHGRAHFSPGTKSALDNWTVLALYFTHRNGPIFRAKTDLSDLQCTYWMNSAMWKYYN